MAMITTGKRMVRWAALATASMLAFPAAAQTAGGPVKPLYGNIRPFYGNLRPFYSNLRPFYGNIRPFWGNLRPFWGDTAAFYGDLKTFWAVDNPVVGAGAPDYLKVGDFWTAQGTAYQTTFDGWDTNLSVTAGRLKGLVDSSRDFWGAAVQAKTGKSFDAGFAADMLAKYGVNLDDPASLANLDPTSRAMFFLDWYDGLMNFSGADHVDHWMKSVNWTPSLTKTEGGSGSAVVGILDQTLVGDSALTGTVIQYKGVSSFTDGHGAAVGSLIVGAHDGKGTMGIAPGSTVFAYNPFDATGTADWDAVTTGVRKLKASGAGVVNMSLGVPGKTFDPGWNGVFANLATTLVLKNTVFVLAAGNDGVSQTGKINWSPLNPAFLIVGSVDLENNISSFSNRPGSACLATLGLLCIPGQSLKDHFLVAPGELILVSDGAGGVTRMSGTSFAAPLVSGAVALLQDRWPWLVNFPNETAQIILDSAKDLGAPGVDEVYGHGLLDVTASQSPLNFNSLIWYSVKNGLPVVQSKSAVITAYNNEQQLPWSAQGAYFYAYEPLGLLTKRDFAIPLSQKLVGQTVTTLGGAQEQFQSYLLARMGAWARSGGKVGLAAQNGFFASGGDVRTPWGMDVAVGFAPRAPHPGYRDEGPAYQSAMRFSSGGASMTVGFGDGAPALMAQPGFTAAADYDAERGGADPLLGFASGGAFAGVSYALPGHLELSASTLARDEQRDTRALPGLGVSGNGAARYAADAQVMSLAWKPGAAFTASLAWTHLSEATGLLGLQSLDPDDLRHGSTTEGYTAGFAWSPRADLTFAATGTLGRTRPGDTSRQTLAADAGGVTTSAWEAAVTRTGAFAKGDRLRLAISQPLYIESGRLAVQTVQVVDRQTGEIGVVTDHVRISDQRKVAAELLYALPTDGGRADLALFSRAETEVEGGKARTFLAGARYRIGF
jgi:hypothetical protein